MFGEKKKEVKMTAKPEAAKAVKMEGAHMAGEAKELGKEDSIADFVQTQAEKKQGHMAKKIESHIATSSKSTRPYPIPMDEYRCKVGDQSEKEKARALNSEGMGYYRDGLFQAAVTAFKYAHSLNCNYYIPKTNAASTLAKSGKYLEAMGWIEIAYKMNATKTISKLKNDPDYTHFIREFLLNKEKNPDSSIARDYMAAVHRVPSQSPARSSANIGHGTSNDGHEKK